MRIYKKALKQSANVGLSVKEFKANLAKVAALLKSRSYHSLDLRNTNIKEIPEGLVIGGWLDLTNINIKGLPENLTDDHTDSQGKSH